MTIMDQETLAEDSVSRATLTSPCSSSTSQHMTYPNVIIESRSDSRLGLSEANSLPYLNTVPSGRSLSAGNAFLAPACSYCQDDGDSGIHGSREGCLSGGSPLPRHHATIPHQTSPCLSAYTSKSGPPSVNCQITPLSSEAQHTACLSSKPATKSHPVYLPFRGSLEMLSAYRVNPNGQAHFYTNGTSVGAQGRQKSQLELHRERMEHHLCRINVLLVCMQLALGASMTGLGVYLKNLSPSLEFKDCTHWAAAPLLTAGIFGLYFCAPARKVHRVPTLTTFMQCICGLLSSGCVFLCMTASVLSGGHGNWISRHSENCDEKPKEAVCCRNSFSALSNLTRCLCRDFVSDVNFTAASYENITCRYVFSALKDYFILQCALMAVGAGVSLWFVVLLIQWQLGVEKEDNPIARHRSVTMVRAAPVLQCAVSREGSLAPAVYKPIHVFERSGKNSQSQKRLIKSHSDHTTEGSSDTET